MGAVGYSPISRTKVREVGRGEEVVDRSLEITEVSRRGGS